MSTDEMTHIVTGGPWRERIGLPCRIVPKLRDEYPWVGKRSADVVVLIEDDPLTGPRSKFADWPGRDWSCVIDARFIAPLTEAGES